MYVYSGKSVNMHVKYSIQTGAFLYSACTIFQRRYPLVHPALNKEYLFLNTILVLRFFFYFYTFWGTISNINPYSQFWNIYKLVCMHFACHIVKVIRKMLSDMTLVLMQGTGLQLVFVLLILWTQKLYNYPLCTGLHRNLIKLNGNLF